MEESVAEFYYKQLMNAKNSIPILVNFASRVLDISDKTKLYPVIGKVLRVFGAHHTYMAILDCAMMESFDNSNPYGIIMYFAKKRFDEFTKDNRIVNDLTPFVMDKVKRLE